MKIKKLFQVISVDTVIMIVPKRDLFLGDHMYQRDYAIYYNKLKDLPILLYNEIRSLYVYKISIVTHKNGCQQPDGTVVLKVELC